MYLHKQKKKNGDIYLSIKEKYHVPKVGSRERTVESLGYLSDLKENYDDPIAHFTEYARELTEKKKSEKARDIRIDMSEKLSVGTNDTRNVGYIMLKILYRSLELDKFWNWKTKGRNIQFSTDQIFRLITFSRALQPGSKKFTLENSGFFFEPFDGISLDDMYNALDVIAENQNDLQKWIFEHSKKILERDMSVSYFDCTNYYFDISHPDIDNFDEDGNPVDEKGNPVDIKYRKRGPEKNHRPDPIVEMGLLIDKNGIPIAYDMFPGNESEKVHMRPIINRVKKETGGRVIFVADRGLNTSDNIYYLNGDNRGDSNQRDGYVYGQTVRGASDEFKKWVLGSGYITDTITDDDGNKITFRHKSRIFPKVIQVQTSIPGQKKKKKKHNVTIDQRQMVYYSEKYAKRQKRNRDIMVERAKDLVKNPKKYDRITSKGCAAYVVNIAFNKDTGEIVEGIDLSIDNEKIKEEEKYDGYYSIVTSELEMSDLEIRNIYRGLARIEDSFKVTKTCFSSRPVYVRTNEHIDAHFATCFVALVLIRILESLLENRFPVNQILDSLKKYNCVQIEPATWQFTYYNDILKECSKLYDLDLNKKYRSQLEIRRLLKY